MNSVDLLKRTYFLYFLPKGADLLARLVNKKVSDTQIWHPHARFDFQSVRQPLNEVRAAALRDLCGVASLLAEDSDDPFYDFFVAELVQREFATKVHFDRKEYEKYRVFLDGVLAPTPTDLRTVRQNLLQTYAQ